MLIKKSSGLVFDEVFNLQTWDITNPIKTSSKGGILSLSHDTTKDTIVLRDIPNDVTVFEAIVEYTPTVSRDAGGLILYKNKEEYIELLEVKDFAQNNLENIKVIRNGNQYDLYMYRNGAFEFIDSIEFEFLKIGFVAKQGDVNFEQFTVNRFIAASSSDLKIAGLQADTSIKLVTAGGTYNATPNLEGIAFIELPHIEMMGTLFYLNSNGDVIDELTDTFITGDEYYVGSQLIVCKTGVELSTWHPNNIGTIQNDKLEMQLELYNPTTIQIRNAKLKIEQYSTDLGYTWTEIALDDNSSPTTYKDELVIRTIASKAIIKFWVKLVNPIPFTKKESFMFYIDITHD